MTPETYPADVPVPRRAYDQSFSQIGSAQLHELIATLRTLGFEYPDQDLAPTQRFYVPAMRALKELAERRRKGSR